MKKIAFILALVVFVGAGCNMEQQADIFTTTDTEAGGNIDVRADLETETIVDDGQSEESTMDEDGENTATESGMTTTSVQIEVDVTTEVSGDSVVNSVYAITSGSSSYSVQKEFLGKPTQTVVGTTGDVTGQININGKDLSLDVNIKNTFATGVGGRDGDVKKLLGGDIAVKANGLVLGEGFFTADGSTGKFPLELTINGVTKTVDFAVIGSVVDNKITASGQAMISMLDFNMTPPSVLKVYTVQPSTTISFEIVAS